MASEFEMGRLVGNLEARVQHLESLVALNNAGGGHKKCGCSGEVKIHDAILIDPADYDKTPLLTIKEPIEHSLLPPCSQGKTACINRVCCICCGSTWYKIGCGANNADCSCGTRGEVACPGGGRYRVFCDA